MYQGMQVIAGLGIDDLVIRKLAAEVRVARLPLELAEVHRAVSQDNAQCHAGIALVAHRREVEIRDRFVLISLLKGQWTRGGDVFTALVSEEVDDVTGTPCPGADN